MKPHKNKSKGFQMVIMLGCSGAVIGWRRRNSNFGCRLLSSFELDLHGRDLQVLITLLGRREEEKRREGKGALHTSI